RIAGAIEKQQAGLRRDGSGELARGDFVALSRTGERHHRLRVGEQNHIRVGDPVGRRDHGLIVSVEHRHAEIEDRLLGARAHQDLRALVLDAVVAGELRRNGVLELVDALDVRIARESAANGVDTRLRDGHRGIEVGLACPEADHILALCLEAGGEGLTRWTRRETDKVTGFPVGRRKTGRRPYITRSWRTSPSTTRPRRATAAAAWNRFPSNSRRTSSLRAISPRRSRSSSRVFATD